MKKQLYYVVSSLLSAAFLLFSPSIFAEKESLKYTPFSIQTGGTGAKDVKKAKENLEIPDVVQSTGQSETAVMSQKAVSDALEAGSGGGVVITQEPGQSTTYVMSQKAVTDTLDSSFQSKIVQSAGESITEVMSQKAVTDAINSVPGTTVVQVLGESETSVMSQKAVTDVILTSQTIFNMIYPIGAVYISSNYVDPSLIFGGTWEQIQDKFLLSAGSSYSANDVGGNESISLSASNIPSHAHSFSATTSNNGVHTHGFSASTSYNGEHTHNVGRDYDGGSGASRYTVHNSGSSGAGGQSPTNLAGGHTHSLSGTTSSSGSHTHSVSGTTSNVGNGSEFNIMPPYVVVYMWKRTA